MIVKQLSGPHIPQQHLNLLVPRHLLHLRDGRPDTGGLGEEPRAQRIIALCGTDGTAAFLKQHGDKSKPNEALDGFQIGVLALP